MVRTHQPGLSIPVRSDARVETDGVSTMPSPQAPDAISTETHREARYLWAASQIPPSPKGRTPKLE